MSQKTFNLAQILSTTFAFLVLISQLVGVSSISTLATGSSKDIKFAISKVVKDGKDIKTDGAERSFSFSDSLSPTDAIKYQWEGVDINTKYRDNPAVSGGYLKVYLNDETKDSNFLTDSGTDNYPLKLANFTDKLNPGKNTLIFQFVNSDGQKSNRTTFNFNFSTDSIKPKITVIKPAENFVFAKGISQVINLELQNFKLTTLNEKTLGLGKLNIYANDLNNLVGTMTSGTELADNKFRVDILPEALTNFEKLPDSKDTTLIFQLINSGTTDVVATQNLKITTNYTGTIPTTYSTVKFIDPTKDSAAQPVTDDRKFLTEVKNFAILDKAPLNNSDKPNGQKGFYQIFIDNKPIQTMWSKPDFTLKEIGYVSNENGEKEVRVQLVDSFFSKLVPEATDKIKIQYNLSKNQEKKNILETGVQTNNWKIIIIILTVILVLGGILISITRA
jgi:hypothetical protein